MNTSALLVTATLAAFAPPTQPPPPPATRAAQAPAGTDAPAADFLGGYGNGTKVPTTILPANAGPVVFLPPERALNGPPKAEQVANVFVPPGAPPRDGWPVAFMSLYGGGNAVFPVPMIQESDFTARLWEAVNAGMLVVNWGAPNVGNGQGMFFPPGHPSGRYESFLRADDNSYKDVEWVIQYFKQSAQVATWEVDPASFGAYASSQGSQNVFWATMGPDRKRAAGSAQAMTSTWVEAVVGIGTEGSIWAYVQDASLGINAPQLFERKDMPGVPATELSQVDEELQKDASFSRWMTETQEARDHNAALPICFMYIEPVKMISGMVADTSLDANGDPVLHDTIGQPYIHDSWNFLIHVNKLLGISQASIDFHLTQGNSIFALEESVAATLGPPYDVWTHTYTGPIFGEEQNRLGVNFLREHLLLPLCGDAPLRVYLTDESDGDVSTWAWDLGDGTTSTLQDPVHTYAAPGTYAVALTVSGASGTDAVTEQGFLVVGGAVNAGLADGSFEGQSEGARPGSPWSILAGGAHGVRAGSTQADNGMPAEGDLWVELDAGGSVAAAPPSNPGGVTAPPAGGVGVGQSFTLQPNATGVRFDAAFLRDGIANDPLTGDWMSVDVTDGATTWNLDYADSFTPTPNTSSVHGLPMTDVQTVHADLAQLFPAWTSATVFTLSVEVGNGGDGNAPSKGYIDDFEFSYGAVATLRNGTGVNALCYVNAEGPSPGFDWHGDVVTSGHPGATLTAIVGYDTPLTGIVTAFGELLVAIEALGGVNVITSVVVPAGGVASHVISVPDEAFLLGYTAYTQAVILGGGIELCNAYDLRFGF